MKFSRILTFIFLLLIVCVSCHKKEPRLSPTAWTPINPEFDSAMMSLEKAYLQFESDSVCRALTDNLAAQARILRGNRQAAARLNYWRARMFDRLGDENAASRAIKEARRLTDSASYPYDMARIRQGESDILKFPPARTYNVGTENLELYNNLGDSVMMASTYNLLSSIFKNMSDTARAKDYLDKASDIYQRLGYERARAQILINKSGLYDRQRADSVLGIVRKIEWLPKVEWLYLITLYNSYLYTGDIVYLDSLYARIKDRPEHAAGQSHVEAFLSECYFEDDVDPKKGGELAERAYTNLKPDFPIITRYVSTMVMAIKMEHEGRLDSAMSLYQKGNALYLEYLAYHQNLSIVASDNKVRVEQIEKNFLATQASERIRFFGIMFMVVAAAAILSTLLYLRWKNTRISKERSEMELENTRMKQKEVELELENARIEQETVALELEKDRMQLAATRLAIESKDKAFQSMMGMIDDFKKKGKISPTEANAMSSAMKVYLSDDKELATFQDIFAKLHPNFLKNLKEKCPSLTEGQLKLATYIAMGMPTQQISNLLMVDYQSVNKNRYRIRTKLGLSKEDSLDDFLRNVCD